MIWMVSGTMHSTLMTTMMALILLQLIHLFPLNELEQIDSDGDGIGDYADLDDDDDGYADEVDKFPVDSTENNDTDSDGIGNDNADTDDDGDGWSDTVEGECMSDPLNKTDTPPDLNSNSICDLIENYTYVPFSNTEQNQQHDACLVQRTLGFSPHSFQLLWS